MGVNANDTGSDRVEDTQLDTQSLGELVKGGADRLGLVAGLGLAMLAADVQKATAQDVNTALQTPETPIVLAFNDLPEQRLPAILENRRPPFNPAPAAREFMAETEMRISNIIHTSSQYGAELVLASIADEAKPVGETPFSVSDSEIVLAALSKESLVPDPTVHEAVTPETVAPETLEEAPLTNHEKLAQYLYDYVDPELAADYEYYLDDIQLALYSELRISDAIQVLEMYDADGHLTEGDIDSEYIIAGVLGWFSTEQSPGGAGMIEFQISELHAIAPETTEKAIKFAALALPSIDDSLYTPWSVAVGELAKYGISVRGEEDRDVSAFLPVVTDDTIAMANADSN